MVDETEYGPSVAISKTFKVKPKLRPKSRSLSKTPESKYWSSFKSHRIQNLISSIPSISFSPLPNANLFAAAVSTSITLYSTETVEATASISSFKDVVSSCSFRADGSLLAASDLSGLIQVFNVKNKTSLRHLRSHNRPVRFVRYPYVDKAHLVSGGDDALVKYWDITGESVVLNLHGHNDYIRCGDWSPVNDGILASGSYDHMVKLWDVRADGKKSVLDFNHGKPVEDVVFLPSGGMIATAGGNCVKLWDVIGGGRLVYSLENHNKTVTGVCIGRLGKEVGEEYRLFSVGLDGYMKIFDFGRMKIGHTMRFPAPLMSVAVSPESNTRVIGTSNGNLFVGKKKMKEVKEEFGQLDAVGVGRLVDPGRRVIGSSNFRYFNQRQSVKPKEGDFFTTKQKNAKPAAHDKLLKKFRHKEALISVLGCKDPEKTVAVMEELIARRKLLKCVQNLDEMELNMLMSFLQKYATVPRHSRLLLGLTKKVLELRSKDIKGSEALRTQILNLRRSINEEIRIQHSLLEIQGLVSPLLRIAAKR